MRQALKRYGIVVLAWLPFFVIWVFFTMIYGRAPLAAALATSIISMGTASLLGVAVWYVVCERWPWPLQLTIRFYLLHVFWACVYALVWNFAICIFEAIRSGSNIWKIYWNSPVLGWEMLMGVWLYGLFAGVSYALQTRLRLHEKEALIAAARLDAIRARLNPHFLFNALHTLGALVKFRPGTAEGAIERLGDMLRYTLKEDGRELVEFSEEYDFTRQYIAFEQLRYEDRLQVHWQIDPESFHFDVPPFSLQILAENAVRHAISIRPEGGSIWISTYCQEGKITITVRDDGPGSGNGTSGHSHQFGLRSLRERLQAAFDASADLSVQTRPDGFEASFFVPAPPGVSR